MNPTRFEEANALFKAPKNSPEGLVSDVAAFTDGNNVITYWQPDARERLMIAAGQGIYVRLLCGGRPQPVSLHVDSPFIEPPDEGRKEELQAGADCCSKCSEFKAVDSNIGTCRRWRQSVTPHYVCHDFNPIKP